MPSEPFERAKISIILLGYNRSDLTEARLAELSSQRLDDGLVEVIAFDNASTDGTPLVMAAAAQHYKADPDAPRLITGRATPNRGFGGGFNLAVGLSTGECIALLSNDVQVYGDIVRPTARQLSTAPDMIIGHSIITRAAGWNCFGNRMIPYLQGYFLAMRRDLWNKLGGFDEDFAPYDYEDLDLSYRAEAMGVALFEDRGLPVHHLGAQTIGYNPERYEQTVAMRALFARKHELVNEPMRP